MKQPLIRNVFLVIVAFLAISPTLAFAYTPTSPWDISIFSKPIVICTALGNDAHALPNGDQVPALPSCHDLCDLVYQFVAIVYLLMAAVIWIIAPLSFIVGGIMYMLAGANPGLESAAKNTLKGAVIGVVIVLCSYILVFTFVSFLEIKGIGGFGSAICSTS